MQRVTFEVEPGFSALQRAENFSIFRTLGRGSSGDAFQCSSASRKFLNEVAAVILTKAYGGFSALQRAENFSICCAADDRGSRPVSVLFSEPKISQWRCRLFPFFAGLCFSALQRAENFSIEPRSAGLFRNRARFSALQRAENFSIKVTEIVAEELGMCFSALQRAENFSIFAHLIRAPSS